MTKQMVIHKSVVPPSTRSDIHVESMVKASGTSFYWAMRRLPPAKRAAMYAIYAFCREVDDIADDIGEPGAEAAKLEKLAEWRDEIGRLFAGNTRSVVGHALLPAVETFHLRQEDFNAIISGMEMDTRDRVRIKDLEELIFYCDCVASAVGRLSTRVFGLDASTGDRLAFAQGQALQMTNILRDVDEDAERDRLYLPADVLSKHGITRIEDLAAVMCDPRLHDVCKELADRAAQHFHEALAIIETCDREDVRPAVMMLEVYRRILTALIQTGWMPPRRRVRLSPMVRLWVMFWYGML